MGEVTSFSVNHLLLEPGIYVNRKDRYGELTITTFDIRVTKPNVEPVMNTAEMHTFEHLVATCLRNDDRFGDSCIYWGPMGCRTGFYLLLAGDLEPRDVVPLMIRCFEFVRDFEGEIPGAAARDCGNYLDLNLQAAKYWAKLYLERTLYSIDEKHMVYPE